MKMIVKFTDIDREDISNLFSVAFYGNGDFELRYCEEDYNAIPQDKRTRGNIYDEVCYEDKCADILMNGGKVYVVDYLAGGEEFGLLPSRLLDEEDKESSPVEYEVTLKDIEKAYDIPQAKRYAQEMFEGNDDFYTGYNLIQFVLFGELVYG